MKNIKYCIFKQSPQILTTLITFFLRKKKVIKEKRSIWFSTNKRNAWSFTLIELLVVIAIIAILAGMLLPALSKARQRAFATSCLSNFKQQGVLTALYRDDFGGFYPLGSQKSSPPAVKDYTSWTHRLAIYLSPRTDINEIIDINYMSKNATSEGFNNARKTLAIFICPQDKTFFWSGDIGSHVSGNYGANVNLLGHDTLDGGYKPKKENQVKNPSEVGQAWDAQMSMGGGGPFATVKAHTSLYGTNTYGTLSNRHKTVNVLRADGSASGTSPKPSLPIGYAGLTLNDALLP